MSKLKNDQNRRLLQVGTKSLFTPRFWAGKPEESEITAHSKDNFEAIHGPNKSFGIRPTSVAISTYMMQRIGLF